MRSVLPASKHFYYFLPSHSLSSRGWEYGLRPVTVSFRHLRSAVDAVTTVEMAATVHSGSWLREPERGTKSGVTDQVHSKDPSPVARVIVSGLAMAERS